MEGVTEVVLSTGIGNTLAWFANYSKGGRASRGLAGSYLFSIRQDAQTALPVDTD
jgi:hypothetical protein